MDLTGYVIAMRVIGVFTIPISLCGIFCLIKVNVKSLSCTYKRLLISYVILSSSADLCFTVLFTPVILAPALAGYNVGLMNFISPVLQYSIALGISVAAALVMELQFHFRFNCLLPLNSRWYLTPKGLRVLHGITMLYGIFTVGHIYFSFGNSEEVKNKLIKDYPQLREEMLRNDTIAITPDGSGNGSFFYYFSAVSFGFHCILVIIMVAFCLKMLSSNSSALSAATKKSAKYYLKCLMIQFSVHSVMFGGPFIIMFYIQFIFEIGNRDLTNVCMTCVALQGSFGIITMMMVMTPYRAIIFKCLGWLKIPESQIVVIVPRQRLTIRSRTR